MKLKYSIGLLAFAIIMTAAYYGSYQYTMYKYEKDLSAQQEQLAALESEENAAIKSVDSVKENRITSDTKYVLEIYNVTTNELEKNSIAVPAAMLGLNREELNEYLEKYESSPTDKDKQEGFLGCQLISFSSDSVVVRKIYELEYMFYLIEEDDRITVYYKDKETIFEYTDVQVSSLPEDLQEELREGKYIRDNEELFSFLENYSS